MSKKARQFLIFLAVGGGAFVIDAGIYYALTRWFSTYYILARIISLVITFIWSYNANRSWTFKAQGSPKALFRYTVVNASVILMNLLGMKVAVDILHFPDLASLVILTLVISVLSFAIHRLWSFKPHTPVEPL